MDELDVIELLTPVGKCPTGTAGTVIKLLPTGALVEIASEEDGSTLDMIDVSSDQAKVVWAIKDQRPAGTPHDALEPAHASARRRRS